MRALEVDFPRVREKIALYLLLWHFGQTQPPPRRDGSKRDKEKKRWPLATAAPHPSQHCQDGIHLPVLCRLVPAGKSACLWVKRVGTRKGGE